MLGALSKLLIEVAMQRKTLIPKYSHKFKLKKVKELYIKKFWRWKTSINQISF